jgi:hypothetical protein
LAAWGAGVKAACKKQLKINTKNQMRAKRYDAAAAAVQAAVGGRGGQDADQRVAVKTKTIFSCKDVLMKHTPVDKTGPPSTL